MPGINDAAQTTDNRPPQQCPSRPVSIPAPTNNTSPKWFGVTHAATARTSKKNTFKVTNTASKSKPNQVKTLADRTDIDMKQQKFIFSQLMRMRKESYHAEMCNLKVLDEEQKKELGAVNKYINSVAMEEVAHGLYFLVFEAARRFYIENKKFLNDGPTSDVDGKTRFDRKINAENFIKILCNDIHKLLLARATPLKRSSVKEQILKLGLFCKSDATVMNDKNREFYNVLFAVVGMPIPSPAPIPILSPFSIRK